jgi:hypothetical protein
MAYYEEGEESLITGFGTKEVPLDTSAQAHYRDKRAVEYPDIGEQLDDLFKQGLFSDAMTARIQAVKDRYAKITDEEQQEAIAIERQAQEDWIAQCEAQRAIEETERLAAKLKMENDALEEYYQAHPEERP